MLKKTKKPSIIAKSCSDNNYYQKHPGKKMVVLSVLSFWMKTIKNIYAYIYEVFFYIPYNFADSFNSQLDLDSVPLKQFQTYFHHLPWETKS